MHCISVFLVYLRKFPLLMFETKVFTTAGSALQRLFAQIVSHSNRRHNTQIIFHKIVYSIIYQNNLTCIYIAVILQKF